LKNRQKQSWMARLKAGLSKTSNNLSILFVGAKIDDDLYDELEAALLMSDAGVEATEYLLTRSSARSRKTSCWTPPPSRPRSKAADRTADPLERRSNWAATPRP
jgi:signal recognition particle GTPase